MNERSTCALGIDVGGTKLAAAVVSSDGSVLGRHEVATPETSDGDVVFEAVCTAADGAVAAARGECRGSPGRAIAGIGVATAGPVDTPAGTVSPVNIAGWRAFPLRDRLAARFGLDVRMFGDGIAMVIGEHWLGAAVGTSNALGMVVSTGVGGGLIVSGRVVFGAGGNAGHIGHMSVDPAGPPCRCGGFGCLEAIASGTSIAGWYRSQRGAESDSGGLRTAAEVASAARAGDALARRAFERSASAIGRAVAGVVTLLDLERVVIGGGVARAFDLLEEPLRAAYRRHAGLAYAQQVRVVTARLGGDVGVLGAAAVVLHPDRYWIGS